MAATSYSSTRTYPTARGSSKGGTGTPFTVATQVTETDRKLATRCGVSPVLAAILRLRGIEDPAAVQEYLNPQASCLGDPALLPDIIPAVERLAQAVTERQPVLIHGDYDADGLASTALLVRSLRALSVPVEHYIPERVDGYGIAPEAIDLAVEKGIGLVMTADCGIGAHETAQHAIRRGVDLIITDHHEPGDTLPPALAVVNPKRADSRYGFRDLCGCAVAFKVMQALVARVQPAYADSFFNRFVELVGLATVADCMPLVGENRYLAAEGLRRLPNSKKPGLQVLLEACSFRNASEGLSGRHVSFGLAPRLNAAGRMGCARLGLDLLLSSDLDLCRTYGSQIEELNRERQELTSRVTLEAVAAVERRHQLDRDPLLLAVGEGWPMGVVGLVAARLQERYQRPVVVLSVEGDSAQGSGRSVPGGLDLQQLLADTSHLLERGGGHQAACGLTVSAVRLEEFCEAALASAQSHIKLEDMALAPDAECLVTLPEITLQLACDWQRLEPCGNGNPEPRLLVRQVRIREGRVIGPDGMHLKWKIMAGGCFMDALWWRPGSKSNGFQTGDVVDLVCIPQINEYNGCTSVQLVIKDARPG